MTAREGACEVCTAVSLAAYRDGRVRVVAEADWVVIRHCSVCGAYWDEQPASRPVVVSREEASRRVPDASGWLTVGPLLGPRDPTGLLVDVRRQDAHQGDIRDLHRQAELAGDATMRDVLAHVLEPFLRGTPRVVWRCRARIAGEWADFAKISSGARAEELFVAADSSARDLAGRSVLEVACRPAGLR